MAKYIITREGKKALEELRALNSKVEAILEAAIDGVINDDEIRTLRVYTHTLNRIEDMGLIRRVD